ncbi:MAG: TIGR03620 family F420-dependent LLM class oxidoreductase [Chloroflexota bacterium]|nr:TIGR03620 family F420-dependent LLM class oxidoreductase [Chloroflexota bacterium]
MTGQTGRPAAALIGRIGVWGHLDSLDSAGLSAYVRRADELGYGALWVPETVGREPFALLALACGETSRIALGTSIISIWGRDAQATRMGAMTLQEASEGRFVLGLGVSHAHLAQRLRGHVYEKPLARMREYLAAYRSAIYRGPGSERLDEPPVLVAALRERMLGLAASDADGAFPYLVTPQRLAWMRERIDEARAEQRRLEAAETSARERALLAVTVPCVLERDAAAARSAARAYLAPYLRVPNYQASWTEQGFDASDWEKPGSDRLVDAMVAWGGPDALQARISAMQQAGADHVAIIPLAPDGTTEHLGVLEALAPEG